MPEPPPPEVAPALALFERGDFRGARAALLALQEAHPPEEAAAAARDLLARMAPDPWALPIGILAALLLGTLIALYVL